jgi:Ni,Fe-hydrogenase I large subunit
MENKNKDKVKVTFLQKIALILAHRSGLVVDMSTKTIMKPKLTETDQKAFGAMEAKLITEQQKNKELQDKSPKKKEQHSIDFDKIIKAENMLPKGNIKQLMGVNGIIGTSFLGWYRTYDSGAERIWFVVKVGKAPRILGGKSMAESLTDPNLDVKQQILKVQFTTTGKFVHKEYTPVDPVPQVLNNSSYAEANALISSIADLLMQNSQAKKYINTELVPLINAMKKEYQEIINSSLTSISKQQAEIADLKSKMQNLQALKEAKKKQEETQKKKEEAKITPEKIVNELYKVKEEEDGTFEA